MIVSQSYHTRTIPQPSNRTITIQLTTAASLLVELAHPGDSSMHRALKKAEMRLLTQPWRADDGVLAIASVSHPGDVRYTDGETCDCETRKGTCWHRAACLILNTLDAAGCSLLANIPLPAVVDEAELPGSFLDGPFDWADDIELTSPRCHHDAVTMPPRRRVREAA